LRSTHKRGRVTSEAKTITGAGTFVTSYGYDAMDRVVTTTYPSGEVVTQPLRLRSGQAFDFAQGKPSASLRAGSITPQRN
jgi:YD repeat-containing protein